MNYNKLKLNVEKTKFMVITNRMIDKNYIFVKICDLNEIFRSYSGRKTKTKTEWKFKLYVHQLLRLTYCSTLLYIMNDEPMKRLQKIQNKIMRLILRCNKRTSIIWMVDDGGELHNFTYHCFWRNLCSYLKRKFNYFDIML
jgi:hypothetical protein